MTMNAAAKEKADLIHLGHYTDSGGPSSDALQWRDGGAAAKL
jgi:hypothetical protein